MKLVKFLILLLFFSMSFQKMAEAKPLRLLLTSFDPFGAKKLNNTQAIVSELNKISDQLGEEVIVKICNLPVVYDMGAKSALDCVAEFHPDVVISFGEGSCEAYIETAATNWDSSLNYPDNSGQIRNGSAIIPGGPQRSGFPFPVDSMYPHFDHSLRMMVSSDPGAYVCNNTAYLLSEQLKKKQIFFTFIHVPNAYCSPLRSDPKKNAQALAKMISAAIKEIRDQPKIKEMPATKIEAQAYLQDLQKQQASSSKISFAERLLSSYVNK